MELTSATERQAKSVPFDLINYFQIGPLKISKGGKHEGSDNHDVKPEESKSDLFVRKVCRETIVDEKITNELRAGVVTFDPGARTKGHTHTNEQVLYVIEGKGIVS